MTISSEVRKAGPFTGNGAASVFPFPFKAFEDDDLEVVYQPAAGGPEQILVLDSDYSVTLNMDQDASPGGSIQLLAGPLANGDALAITTDLPELQETDITNGGGFYPEVMTAALDYLTILVQQLQIAVGASLHFPMIDSSDLVTELPPASERANTVLTFGPDGSVQCVIGGITNLLSRANGMITGNMDGVNTTFTLALAPLFPAVTILVLSGSILPHQLYSISGTTLTITTPIPPQRGDTLEIYCL
jgi:hypothetical protein